MAATREQSRGRRLVAVDHAASRPDAAVVEGRPDWCAQAWENGIATWRWIGVTRLPVQPPARRPGLPAAHRTGVNLRQALTGEGGGEPEGS